MEINKERVPKCGVVVLYPLRPWMWLDFICCCWPCSWNSAQNVWYQ